MRKLIIGVPVIVLLFTVALGTYWLTNSSEPTVVKDSGGTSEGIKVHGDWEVTVIDPDNGEEKLYAFSNDLADNSDGVGGALTLANLLTLPEGDPMPGGWMIIVQGEGPHKLPHELCTIPTIPTRHPDGSGDQQAGYDGITLAGSCQTATPLFNGKFINTPITLVGTGMAGFGKLTERRGLEIPLEQDQTIAITVHITFE